MQTHSSWANWFVNHGNNDAGNKNIQAFCDILSSGDSNEVKLQALVEDIDTVILSPVAAEKLAVRTMVAHGARVL